MEHHRAATALVGAALAIVGCGSPSDASPASTSTPATASPEASAVGTEPTPSVTSVTTTNGGSSPSPLIAYGWGAPCAQAAPGDGWCLVGEDGSNAHAILTELGGLADFDWSRDGGSIVFTRKDTPGQLWITDTVGGDVHPVLADAKRCPTEARVPAWSPDGAQIAFMCLNGTQTEIAIAEVATGAVTSVYVASKGEEAWNPRWSPDGTKLVFERDPNDGVNVTGGEIVVTRAAGGDVTVVAPAAMFAGYPDWSPKGDLIVFDTYQISVFQTGGPGPTNLYTVAPDGSHLKQLTTNELGGDRDSQPSFTPDGERVIFTHTTPEDAGFGGHTGYGTRRAAFINLDGTGLTVVNTVYATHPRLQPVD